MAPGTSCSTAGTGWTTCTGGLSGTTWSAGTVITDAGTGYSYNNDGNFQPWGSSVDYADPNVVWLLKDNGDSQPAAVAVHHRRQRRDVLRRPGHERPER